MPLLSSRPALPNLLLIPTPVSLYHRPACAGRASCHIVEGGGGGGRSHRTRAWAGASCVVRGELELIAASVPLVVYRPHSSSPKHSLRLRPVRAVLPLSRVLPNPPHSRRTTVTPWSDASSGVVRVGARVSWSSLSLSVDGAVLAYAEPGSRVLGFVTRGRAARLSSTDCTWSPRVLPRGGCFPGNGLKGRIPKDATRGCSM
ncbi:hypothetical protein B0H17DRAFT_1095193 [Mycena rosella]|uniref:Uncharacterized protein n=1 Tax=Mycena rosella TaxID=1033263 RepID=A0AAD7G6F3_MYCRO|nr:hypothetical protein B0H17DRAFT_1095193 [Mycena rosella]